jgi:NADPH:quinone reductase-like Zn-dependent oxidoreductase
MAAALRSVLFTGAAPLRTLINRRAVTAAPRRSPSFLASSSAVRAMSEASGKKIVLVTGATGRVGKEVVARLAKQDGFIVRAATRDKAAYATALGGVVHVDAP